MATAKDLRAQALTLSEQAQRLVAEVEEKREGKWAGEEDEQFRAMHADADALIERAKKIEESESRIADLNRSAGALAGAYPVSGDAPASGAAEGPDELHKRAFDHYVRFGKAGMEPQEVRTLQGMHVTMGTAEEARALGIGTGTAGGYLVPSGTIADAIVEARKDFDAWNKPHPRFPGQTVATVINSTNGAPLEIPYNDDTGNEGELVSEGAEVGDQDTEFGLRTLTGYLISSKVVKVNLTLMQDSAFPLDSWLGRKLGERIGRKKQWLHTNGTGANQPAGLTVQGTVGKTGASATTFTHPELLDLKHSVDPAYRDAGIWMMNDASLLALKKLNVGGATDARPLWQQSIAAGEPATIDGDPYVINQSMPAPASGAKSIAYGDTRALWVRDISGWSLVRLEELYARFGQVGFLLFARTDSGLMEPNAIKLFEHA